MGGTSEEVACGHQAMDEGGGNPNSPPTKGASAFEPDAPETL